MCRLWLHVQRVVLAATICAVVGGRVSGDDSPQIIAGAVRVHTVEPGDTLTSLSARFGVDLAVLAADNRLQQSIVLRPGQMLRIDGRHIVPVEVHHGILINIPQRMLFVALDGRIAGAYPIAVGRRDWPSPVGTFEVGVKESDPTWDVPLSIQREMALAGRPVLTAVPPGPDNPLGDRWLGIKGTGIGIHGTNQPASIFRFTTHGCIRLHPDDAREVFELADVGMPVRLIYQPVLAAVNQSGRPWLEVHRDAYGRSGDLLRLALALLERADVGDVVDPAAVARCVQDRHGRPCRL
jgi:L,D-transpeptidase ErfK/SrfK